MLYYTILLLLLSLHYTTLYYTRGGPGGSRGRGCRCSPAGGEWELAGSARTVDFRNFIVFFWAKTLAH